MRPELHIDFETRSEIDLRKVGLPVYADDPTTDLWCACWAFTDDQGVTHTGEWLREADTTEINAILRAGPLLFAHNAGFEHELWLKKWGPVWGVKAPASFEDWSCTAAMAAAMALPRALGNAAKVLGLPVQKDSGGHTLMMQMCKPRSRNPTVWWEAEDKVRRLVDYCHTDVKVEHLLAKALRPLSGPERAIWQLDHKINQRGVLVDLEAVAHARAIGAAEADRLDGEIQIATGFALKGAKHPASITAWLNKQGVDAKSLDKASIKELLASPELTPAVKHVIRIRDEARRSSLSKLDAFLDRTSSDGRLRQQLLYHGASTGRWTGAGVQLQNLMRPWMKYADILAAFNLIPARDPDLLRLVFGGTALDVLANMMRSFIIAAPGHELVMADFSNIEGRVLAWLAGEEWKLDAFRAYDEGRGPDLYVVTAAKTLGLTNEEIDDFRRQIGKVIELSLGFGGGHGAFLKMAANYGLSIRELAEFIQAATGYETWETVADGFEADNRHELDEQAWTALRLTIDNWRDAHPNLCGYGGLWQKLEEAAFAAVRNPGKAFHAGRITFIGTRSILYCRLPSGRYLAYATPLIQNVKTPWGGERLAVTFKGQDQVTKQWITINAYGGFWSQQVTQGIARDLMAEAMVKLEGAGWPVILTIHDEIVCEVAVGTVSAEAFGAAMRELPTWADGLPVAAKGMTSMRYRK